MIARCPDCSAVLTYRWGVAQCPCGKTIVDFKLAEISTKVGDK